MAPCVRWLTELVAVTHMGGPRLYSAQELLADACLKAACVISAHVLAHSVAHLDLPSIVSMSAWDGED